MIEDDPEFSLFLGEYLEKYNIKITNFEDPYLGMSAGIKNFDLLIKDLGAHQKNQFTNYIFSNQPKQIERLYQIFEDIGGDVEFIPMNMSLHEGFICKTLKIVCYTDHQRPLSSSQFQSAHEGWRKI